MSHPPQLHQLSDTLQIGDKIQVKWSTDNEYHQGTVREILQSGLHKIFYAQDNLSEDLKLEQEQWCFKYPSCDRRMAPQLIPFHEAPATRPEETLKQIQDTESSEEYVTQPEADSLLRRRAERLRTKSRWPSSDNADTPRRSLRLSTRGYESLVSVRRSSRLSSKKANNLSEAITLKSAVFTPDAFVYGNDRDTSMKPFSSEKSHSLPCAAQSCGSSGIATSQLPAIPSADSKDIQKDSRPNWKSSRELLNTRVSNNSEPEDPSKDPSSEAKGPEHCFSYSPTNPPINLECSTIPARVMTPIVNSSSTITNSLNRNASFPVNSLQSGMERRKIPSEQEGYLRESGLGSDAKQKILFTVDSDEHGATRKGKSAFGRNISPTKAGPKASSTLRKCKSHIAGPEKGLSSTPAMTIQKHRGVTNPSSQSRQGTIQVISSDWSDTVADIPVPRKPRDIVIVSSATEVVTLSNATPSSNESSNIGLESNMMSESDHHRSVLDNEVPPNSPTKKIIYQNPLDSPQMPLRQSSLLKATRSGLSSAATSDLSRKRRVSEVMIMGNKMQKSNSSTPFSTNTEGEQPKSGTSQLRIAASTRHQAYEASIRKEMHKIPRIGNHPRAAVSVAGPSHLSKVVTTAKSNCRETFVPSFTPTSHRELQRVAETPISKSCLHRSDNTSEYQLRVTSQTSKHPSHRSYTPAPLLRQARKAQFPEKIVIPRETCPALPTSSQQQCTLQGGATQIPVTSRAPQLQSTSRTASRNGMPTKPPICPEKRYTQPRSALLTSETRQQLNSRKEGAETIRNNAGSKPERTAPSYPTRNEMRTSISVENRHVYGVNTNPRFIPAIVRLEKEAASIDMNLRRLMGEGERRNMALNSLQKRVEDTRKKIARIPTTQEVKNFIESRTCDMKEMLNDSLESVTESLRNDMSGFLSHTLKRSLETAAHEIHRVNARMLGRAVEIGLSSQTLEDSRRNTSSCENRNDGEHERD